MPGTLPSHRASIKETITQLVFAFVMAFVFRGFVIEAFLIPTGSMAPTLMGAHMRFTGEDSGYQWAVGPWQYQGGDARLSPTPVQQSIQVTDPMTGTTVSEAAVPLLGGDRIFVLKYLPWVFDPARFDCVVFKNPTNPDENYIKRLIGLPGEQVALIHGDVFVRRALEGESGPVDWSAAGWRIARKPERVQRSLWMPMFSSEFSPMGSAASGWVPPWIGSAGFEVGASPEYVYSGVGTGVLRWDDAGHPIDDYYPYNQNGPGMSAQDRYLVPDVRLRAAVRPGVDDLVVSAVVTASGHEFRVDLEGTLVAIRMRAVPLADGMSVREPGAWATIGTGRLARALENGRVTDVEVWHADQSVDVYVDGVHVALAAYEWTPRERVLHATGRTLDEMLENEEAAWDRVADLIRRGGSYSESSDDHQRSVNIFTARSEYRPTQARWEFSGAVTVQRAGLDRDLYYHPGVYGLRDAGTGGSHPRARQPAMATHPNQPAFLRQGQYFVCGDNSAASLDARLWGEPDPWVAETIDPTIGVVPADLLIGKAFFVYFPALNRDRRVPVVDFGRMRFIW